MYPLTFVYQLAATATLLLFFYNLYYFSGYVKGKKQQVAVKIILGVSGLYLLISTLTEVSYYDMGLLIAYSIINLFLSGYNLNWTHEVRMSEWAESKKNKTNEAL
jgi:hypothetical protein